MTSHDTPTPEALQITVPHFSLQALTHLIECKLSDDQPQRALLRFADEFPETQAVQVVQHLRQEQDRGRLQVRRAAPWLAQLAA